MPCERKDSQNHSSVLVQIVLKNDRFHFVLFAQNTSLLSFKVLGDGVNRVGEVYWKGLENVGSAALGLGGAATDGVSRIGELASEGAATVGGLATNLVDAAATVPEGVMAVARYSTIITAVYVSCTVYINIVLRSSYSV